MWPGASASTKWIFVLGACAALVLSCGGPQGTAAGLREPFLFALPLGAPAIPVPADNPMTVASVRLGEALFFDKRLSVDSSVSCASCHAPHRAFSDTVAFSRGVRGQFGLRNAPTLMNVAYQTALFHDGGVPNLEMQVIAPIEDPLEMGHRIEAAAAALHAAGDHEELSMAAYGRPFDAWVMSRALASYERTLISGRSRFDRFHYGGQTNALDNAEQQGWELFNSERTNCAACHHGFDLSDHSYQNIGLYMDYADQGRHRITLQEEDRGKFKVPTLRNIALTAPYMHDGSMATLEEVIDHFATGGHPHPNKSPLLRPFTLSSAERSDLIAFLNALTDE